MTKYTIYKAFEKNFPFQIWKIVADAASRLLGIELRDPDTNAAILYVLDFEGNSILEHWEVNEKEWTLESLQHNTIILKRIGEMTPIKEGIQLLDLQGHLRYISHEYTWIDTFLHYIKIRHRNFQSGFEEYLDIQRATKISASANVHEEFCDAIKMPTPYNGEVPAYLSHVTIEDRPWISRANDKLLWTYHVKDHSFYNLNLCVAASSNLVYKQCLLAHMPKMIPQPYFQIGNQIFLMSYNKREIVSYLV